MANFLQFLTILAIGLPSLLWSPAYGLNPSFSFPNLVDTYLGTFPLESIVTRFLRLRRPYNTSQLEGQADSYLNTIVGSFPGKGNNLTAPCYEDVKIWMGDMFLGQGYALKMLDSFFKVPPGLTKGHLLMLGSHDMCMRVEAMPYTSQYRNSSELVPAANYCIVRLQIALAANASQPLPPLATCFPASCTARDADILILSVVNIINATVDLVTPTGKTLCNSEIPSEPGTSATWMIVGGFAITCLCATIVHLLARPFDHRYNRNTDIKPLAGPNTAEQSGLSTRAVSSMMEMGPVQTEKSANWRTESFVGSRMEMELEKVPVYIRLILCFSLVDNTSRLFAPEAGELRYLNGIRVMSMWWVLLGHIHQLGEIFFSNRMDIIENLKGYPQQLILSAPFAVDTFFLLSGLAVTYSLLRAVDQHKSWAPFVLSYVRRFARILPLYMVILLIYMFVVPYVVDGPYAILVRQEGSPTEYCKTYWWTNLLMVSNVVPVDKSKMCMPWTWFISADWQLFIVTPPIVAFLSRFPKSGLALLVLLLGGCVATVSSLVYVYGLPLTIRDLHGRIETEKEYQPEREYIYDKPWQGGINYIVGVILAYHIFVRRGSDFARRFKTVLFIFGWAVAFVLAYFAIFGLYYGGFETKTQMSVQKRAVYAGLSRLGWALAVGWVIYACHHGISKTVRSFLSLPIWTPLSRLTYAAFLVHFLILQLYFTSLRSMLFYTTHQVLTIFLAQIVAVYAAAFVASLAIETPVRRLIQLTLTEAVYWMRH
ncbi:putative Nose resistant to fluoxetine protein 6 [Hypsibius exemplaris]|uniref:Nose resistant to fluoxetine protein 6 n=1 Tax=Hypsibius exemplaris TaxID=2072580 RepID=A0A1W0X257_HYPEX|nr:putative Nose resistant to fluoxetine protein 6 [Hypsibius exemplaris]